MAMFIGYLEVSVNFNVEIRREKFIILISILYPIYSTPVESQWIINEYFKTYVKVLKRTVAMLQFFWELSRRFYTIHHGSHAC